jgi:hypothetical protein
LSAENQIRLVEAFSQKSRHLVDAGLQGRLVFGVFLAKVDLRLQNGLGLVQGEQVVIVTGEKKAAFPGFGVFGRHAELGDIRLQVLNLKKVDIGSLSQNLNDEKDQAERKGNRE